MSSRKYTVEVQVKDGGLLKQLGSLGGSGGGGGGSRSSGGGGDLLKKLGDVNVMQLVKLTGIGLGVTALVSTAVKSSSILQANFKLWETSMALIFKPIADFFGIIFMPFTRAMLALFVIPFYKAVYPLFKDHATQIADFFADPVKALTTLGEVIGGAVALALADKFITPPSAPAGTPGAPSVNFPSCIEICSRSVQAFQKPMAEGVKEGIGNAAVIGTMAANTGFLLTMNSSLLDMKTDLRLLKENMASLLNRLPAAPVPNATGGKSFSVDLKENLSVSELIGADVISGIKTDWGTVAGASGAAAVAGAAISQALDAAKLAIAGAVSRLQALASTIPNEFAFGFQTFGNGSNTNLTAAYNAQRARTQMVGMADARSI